ncbi:MAG: sulfotransferase [Kangiellaceae bacterium]|nr:sulfotransferase [Kangiellaceae bacterium]MCW8997650.1 sulfotransferase [Kangiellaceae bacterium]MCW9018095.1 sulfotransferase [Kangiellaceae bacterium]
MEFNKPIFIIGAPRSGTSLFQKIIRSHPDVWSLPSESDMIWDTFCHPSLNDWKSEVALAEDVTEQAKEKIKSMFDEYLMPASFWQKVDNTGFIWGFKRSRKIRKLLRPIYKQLFPIFKRAITRHQKQKRILDKTASNCFRLSYINEIFPDAKIIYPIRDGRNSINSLINGWKNPTRFFTYDVPMELDIKGYEHQGWKFMLPPNWQNYVTSKLEDVCAFQWLSCHSALQLEINKPKYKDRIKIMKLEDLTNSPEEYIVKILEFLELDVQSYPLSAMKNLPVINSPDNITLEDKWKKQNRQLVERILPQIEDMMIKLGYGNIG